MNKNKYIEEQLIPSICRRDKRFRVEDMTGSLSVYTDSGKGFTVKGVQYPYCYATPFWEGAKGIPIGLMDGDADFLDMGTLPFKLTYDLTTDVLTYIHTMNEWIKKHQVI